MNGIRKISLACAAAIGATLTPMLSATAWEAGESYTLSVAGSQPTQSIYAIGVAHKRIIEEAIPGVTLNILATQGGNENIELMMIEEAEIANANAIAAYSAYHGSFVFEGQKDENILGFFPGYTWEIGAVVRADSPYETFRDLLGKGIATGPVGSGAEATVTAALEAIGLADSDFSVVQRSSPTQAFASLTAGQVEAVVWGTAHPAGIYMENAATQDLRFIPFTEEDLQAVAEAMPFYHVGALRAGVYDNQEEVAWIGGSTHFWIHGSVPETLVYGMVKALWESRESLKSSHQSQALLDEDLVRQQASLVPFHPGAHRYFVEQGILTD
jgi:TRAP transporter TAXI family solute receptor